MFTRIALLTVVFSAMGAGGFTLGRTTAGASQASGIGIPQEHPAAVALERSSELKLSPAQTARIESIREALELRLKPFQVKGKELEGKAREMQRSGGDPTSKAQLESEVKALQQAIEAQVPPMMAKATEEVLQTLDQEQREKLQGLLQARMEKSGSDDLVLRLIMEKREPLGITPQQFTKLQYIQADLIRAFAPLREQIELLQLEMQEKPDAEMVQKKRALEQQVAALKETASKQAIEVVLNAQQLQKLQNYLRGSRKPKGDG